MKVTLLGTGSADGWPNPWCDCASCSWAREHEVRGQTAVLIDDALLIDCGPDVPRTAARLGIRLSGLRHLLISHAHPDHLGPESLMWRSWSTAAARPLDVVGPPAALAVCRDFLSRWELSDPERDGSPLRFVPVSPGGTPSGPGPLRLGGADPASDGGRRELGRADQGSGGAPGYEVRPVAARHGDDSIGPAVLYDVTAPDGARLLYGCDTAAPLPEETLDALTGRAFDIVLLEENNGDRPGFGEHLGLDTFSQVVADLRRRGAVLPTTLVLAVHLSHRNPPGDELARRLALIGAQAPADGTVYDIVPAAPYGPPQRSAPAKRPVPPERSASLERSARPNPKPASASASAPRPGSEPASEPGRGPGPAGGTGSDWNPAPRRVLITGGSRSGKSAEAERRLLAEPEVIYVATSAPPDPADVEWSERIAAHRLRRPDTWTTVETLDLVPLLRSPGPPLLIDSLGLWVGAWLEDPEKLRILAADLVDAWRDTARQVIAVTDEVGSGVVPATAAGRQFRDALGRLNADIAAESDEVWHVVAGLPTRLRPPPR